MIHILLGGGMQKQKHLLCKFLAKFALLLIRLCIMYKEGKVGNLSKVLIRYPTVEASK